MKEFPAFGTKIAGVLGIDVLGRFDRVEVDFTDTVIWFHPRGTRLPN